MVIFHDEVLCAGGAQHGIFDVGHEPTGGEVGRIDEGDASAICKHPDAFMAVYVYLCGLRRRLVGMLYGEGAHGTRCLIVGHEALVGGEIEGVPVGLDVVDGLHPDRHGDGMEAVVLVVFGQPAVSRTEKHTLATLAHLSPRHIAVEAMSVDKRIAVGEYPLSAQTVGLNIRHTCTDESLLALTNEFGAFGLGGWQVCYAHHKTVVHGGEPSVSVLEGEHVSHADVYAQFLFDDFSDIHKFA